jgi:hypothetical protein
MANSKKVSTFWCGKVMIGGAEGIRTPDLLRAKEALSRLSYSPVYQKYYKQWGILSAIGYGVSVKEDMVGSLPWYP